MDWIELRLSNFKKRIRNMSFRKAFLMYLVLLALAALAAANITIVLCTRVEGLRWLKYKDALNGNYGFDIKHFSWQNWFSWSHLIRSFEHFSPSDGRFMRVMDFIRIWCPFIYCFLGSVAAMLIFYHKRLKKPLHLLEGEVIHIKNRELDRELTYACKDEMGALVVLVDEMRRELIRDKEDMWQLIDDQKKLNEAFAHDMRTPLTVLKGYTQFLYRYFPAGKLSSKKICDTLALISNHLDRLEDYSKSMHGIRNLNERKLSLSETSVRELEAQITEVLFALNQVGEICLKLLPAETDRLLMLDANLILEVLENMLSNAIRYARAQIQVTVESCRDFPGVVLTVRDDGPGFAQKDFRDALLPYHKDPQEDGSEHFGLGLHIAAELCKKHGGSFNIANSIHGGAMVSAAFRSRVQ